MPQPALAVGSTRRERLIRAGAAVFGVFLIFYAGYYLTYHLFFKDVSFVDLGQSEGGEPVDFRYDGVAYFHGNALRSGEEWTLTYFAPWVTVLSEATIELYVEMPVAIGAGIGDDAEAGLLTIQQSRGETQTIALTGRRLHRLYLDWQVRPLARNQLVISYAASEASRHETVHLATRITEFNVLWAFAILLVAGMALTLFAVGIGLPRERQRLARGRVFVMLVLAGFAFYLHSGAFTSNRFFGPGHWRLGAMSNELGHIGRFGHMSQTNYRDVGLVLVPGIVAAMEGGVPALREPFRNHYPTSRYVIFALFLGAALFLAHALARTIGPPVAVIFVIASTLYFPFVVDLYFPDSDAMLIVLFPVFLALLMRARYGMGAFWVNIGSMLGVFLIIGMTKITPAFLIPVAPLIFLRPLARPWSRQLLVAGLMAVALFVSMSAGRSFSDALQHPERNVGIEGEPFQDTVLWHIIWAAYGYYDEYSAHWFTKSGPERQQRVADRTGLPYQKYLRQSQTASDEVYKPDVLNALQESPGFFYSTTFLRFYNHGLRFFHYSYGFAEWLRTWQEDGSGRKVVISGVEVPELTAERRAIRFDEAWKFSPLVLLLKLTQGDMTRLSDLILLSISLLGLLAIRQPGLATVLVLTGVAQIGFASLIHVPDRYVLFCSIAWLIGLSIALYRLGNIIITRPGSPIAT